MKTKRQETGKIGEEIAAQFLISIGYTVKSRNVSIPPGEIDIIAHDFEDDVLAFVEVKTHGEEKKEYDPSMNAGPRKWSSLRRAMRRWVGACDYRGGYRMDLVCVAGGRVTQHLKEVGIR